jgi:beta-glucosidase
MKKWSLLLLTLMFGLIAETAFAQNTITNTAIIPVPRDSDWMKRHDSFVEQARAGGIDLLFLGDSITDFWRSRGSNVWHTYYGSRHAANFGISGDRTQHVLWRMDHGEVDGIKPKVVVLMIGTNNTGKERDGKTIRNTAPEAVEGITAVVHEIRAKLPESKILLLAIFPRGDKTNPMRDELREINLQLALLADGKAVKFLDIGPHFIEPDGNISKDVMPDLLHPSEKGYQIWAKAMDPTLDQMLK